MALFAALSYAVTQSTRSGGGSAEREKATLSAASLTQGPAAIRTSLIRMVLAGVAVEELNFNVPSSFPVATDPTIGEYVFHPSGGGAVYQLAPADNMAGASQGTWFYNANWNVPQIGIDDTVSGNDIIAFLPAISSAVCKNINDSLAIDTTDCALNDTVPVLNATGPEASEIRNQMNDGNPASFPADNEVLQGTDSGGTCQAFSGQPSGCFYEANNTEYVFYSVLLER